MGAVGEEHTATKVIMGKKLIQVVCNRAAVYWWDEEVEEALRVRREEYARYTSNATTHGRMGRSMLRLERKKNKWKRRRRTDYGNT